MINIVNKELEFADDTIDMLEDKVSKLEKALDYFKELWDKFIKFFKINSYLLINMMI